MPSWLNSHPYLQQLVPLHSMKVWQLFEEMYEPMSQRSTGGQGGSSSDEPCPSILSKSGLIHPQSLDLQPAKHWSFLSVASFDPCSKFPSTSVRGALAGSGSIPFALSRHGVSQESRWRLWAYLDEAYLDLGVGWGRACCRQDPISSRGLGDVKSSSKGKPHPALKT
jgi:hypothetical protein